MLYRLYLKYLRPLLHIILPSQGRRKEWEYNWSKGGPQRWQLGEASTFVRKAVEDNWLKAGDRVLDVGCGSGENARWLAENGFRVTAIDFSSSAISRAQRSHEAVSNLQFHVADITRPLALQGDFDVVLDRGCLHGLPPEEWRRWFDNVRLQLKRSGRVLLLMAVRNEAPDQLKQRVIAEGRSLTVISAESVDMFEGRQPGSQPGILFRLCKTSAV